MTRRVTRVRAGVIVLAVLAIVGAQLSLPRLAQRAQAADPPAPGAITLAVQSARPLNGDAGSVTAGSAIDAYKWLINRDDTGDPGTASNQNTASCLPATAPAGSSDPGYADTCPWPSVRNTSGFAPIIAQGDQTTLNATTELADLAPGKYLISVTAEGFKIDGQHFTVDGGTQRVTVQMNPTPLPLSTVRIEVFNDNAPVDATYEVDAEPGLKGFTAHLTDVFGEMSVDYYGNALCTKYMHRRANGTLATDAQRPNDPIAFDANDKPIVDPASTGKCTSDAQGQIVIPNLGPNRFAATVSPPLPAAGQTYQWVQTTTLEGGHDYDIWSQEGATGFDTEQTKGAELVPYVQFGFVRTSGALPSGPRRPTGEVKGVAMAGLAYIGGQNGQVVPETGLAGAKYDRPINKPWVALSDLGAGDQQIYVGQGNVDGSFDIKNVPNGTYQLTIWDNNQDYILWSFNVDVANGAVTDVGSKMIVGWFTHMHGHVFIDTNGNGKRDPGEQGVPAFALTVRERDNSLMDQYSNTSTTNDLGEYDIPETYPLGKWLVMEAFNTRYQTTGITYRADNEPKATTKLGAGVDLSFLPIIGLGTEVDWGVQPYEPGTNGGIVGTVSYDTTRNELDPAQAASESYQPGIPDVPVRLYLPVACGTTDPVAMANECRQGKAIVPLSIDDPANPGTMIQNPAADRGALVKGVEIQDAYTSETWSPPRGCTARQYNGQPLTDQQALPEFGAAANRMCVEAPMMGVAVGPNDDTPGAFGQTVNGNYGFGTSKVNLWPPTDSAHNPDGLGIGDPLPSGEEQDLRPGDYIVSVDIPDNPVGGGKMYQATGEEDVNVFDGDTYLPQQNYPPVSPAAAAAQDQGVQLATPLQPSQPPSQQAGIISDCAGALHTVHVTNPAFLDGGGSPFEGLDRPSCEDKLVTVRNAQATAPNFNLFTDVPLPTHFWGLTLNDLGLTLDKRSVNYGEAQGLPFVPVGLYDSFGRLSYTAHTDFNGMYEALVPSTDTFNCPVPAGPCPNMYRFVGNDPGSVSAPNADYNPRFRTIATNFQAWPGLYTVTDEAPTQVAATVLAPDSTVANPTMCDLGATSPQIFAVDKPYVRTTDSATARVVTVQGIGFGATPGTLKLGTTTVPVTAANWSDTQVKFTVPTTSTGPRALSITASNGLSTYNGLTIQVLGQFATNTVGQSATNPRLAEVGPGKQFATIQAAIEAARPTNQARFWLVVVWPGARTADNPRGEYTENVIVHHQEAIQGVGPGGFQGNTFVPGSIIDGAGFNPDNPSGAAWITLLSGLSYSGDPAVPDAAAVTVLHDTRDSTVPTSYPLTIDGFTITGGAQSDIATNVNVITGGFKTPYGADGALITQGGGVYVHYNVAGLQVTDNVIVGNGGSYGGGVRVGTPYIGNNHNDNLKLQRNQIRDNGGTNLAGGVGLFTGSNNYDVSYNAICGNHSAEYGGAISAFGYNTGGQMTHNRIWFNQSYDEGGGIMIAGELPANPNNLSEGSGPVTIDANVIQANLANDDGGGIRLLQTSGTHITRANPQTISITSNTIANNVSAHEGGGLALDDSAFVNVVNNTVARNITTATAVTSNGQPAPAGLSTAANSDPLQAKLSSLVSTNQSPQTWPVAFSKPTLLDNVFSDNRAGTFDGGSVTGITAADANYWDLGASDGSGPLTPLSTVLQDGDTSSFIDNPASAGNRYTTDPKFVSPYDISVNILNLRTYPAFRQAAIVSELLPPSLLGNYHLANSTSPAYGAGRASTNVAWGTGSTRVFYTVNAATPDIDGNPRPSPAPARRYDAGSDQLLP